MKEVIESDTLKKTGDEHNLKSASKIKRKRNKMVVAEYN